MRRGYDEYKKSDVGWATQLPAHWEMRKGKRLFKKEDRPVRDGDDVVTAFRDGEVTLRKNRRTEGFTESLSGTGYQGIRKGDLVIHSMDAFAGAIGVSDADGISTPVYAACTPFEDEGVDVHFYKYLLRHMASSGYIESLSKGIRERSTDFRYSEFAEQALPVPPLEEQQGIVELIDQKTEEADRFIEAKQQLIERLEEQRAAVVNRAVTKGLDAEVEMKSTELEWLGEIPSHWEDRRVRYAISFISSGSRGWSDYYDENGSALFLRIGSLKRDSINLDLGDTETISLPEKAEGKRTKIHVGDVLVSITAYIGSIGVVNADIGEAYVSQHVALLRPEKELVDSEWMGYALLSDMGKVQMHQALYGGTKDGLALSDVKDVRLFMPPKDEQKRIVKHIEARTAKIEDAIERAEREIALIREYRQALIAEAVTGQIDVRNRVPVTA